MDKKNLMFENEILYNYFEQCKGILTTISACNILTAYIYHKELTYGRKVPLPGQYYWG